MDDITVITTKYVIEEGSPIVSVFKDTEGEWQFFGNEKNIIEKDARVVGLSEILKMDFSIKKLLSMKNGTHAWRTDFNKEWEVEEY